MSYELKEYLKAINTSKEKLMDSEDEQWEKKYPASIVYYFPCLPPLFKLFIIVFICSSFSILRADFAFSLLYP